jgi:hypothetical protein
MYKKYLKNLETYTDKQLTSILKKLGLIQKGLKKVKKDRLKNFLQNDNNLRINKLYTLLDSTRNNTGHCIDLDKFFKLIRYAHKHSAVKILKKICKAGIDYTIAKTSIVRKGGQNKMVYTISREAALRLFMYRNSIAAHAYLDYLGAAEIAYNANIAIIPCEDSQIPEKKLNVAKSCTDSDLECTENIEASIRDRLAFKLNGCTEVSMGAYGIADVVTDTHVIEVKVARNWKNALGQILAYSEYAKTKKLRVHLFNVQEQDDIALVRTLFSKYKIELSVE